MNYLAIIVGAVVSMVIGYLWYGPLFGKKWMELAEVSPEKAAAAKTGGTYSLLVIGSLLLSFVMANSVIFGNEYMQTSGISGGMQVGFFNWLGFALPLVVGAAAMEGKSWKLWCLNAVHYLVVFLVLGAMFSAWQ